jgi:tetratricopeptide (TPR) repeat protein
VAEEAVRRGEKLITEEKYWDAIQLVEPHLPNARGTGLIRARMVMARAFLKNPNWRKRAEEQLNKVLGDNPRHVEALFLLGDLYQGGGLKLRALAKFRKVTELDSLHEEARARVALLESDLAHKEEEGEEEQEPEPPSGGGGFVKRIFGKGA